MIAEDGRGVRRLRERAGGRCVRAGLDERGGHGNRNHLWIGRTGAKMEASSRSYRRVPPVTIRRRSSVFQGGQRVRSLMTDPTTITRLLSQRPQRADARRNYEKLLARRARPSPRTAPPRRSRTSRAAPSVGIGTLYRHFPTRQHLLEAVYVDEVEAISRSAADLADSRRGSARAVAARVRRLRGHEARAGRGDARLHRPRRRGLPRLPSALYGRRRRRSLERAQAGGSRPPGRQLHGRRAPGRRHRRASAAPSPTRSSACSTSCSTACATGG